MSNQPRCSCGAWVRPCHKCGAIPHADSTDIFDYRPTPARQARIDRRARELRMDRRTVEGRFIDAECEVVA